MGGCHGVRWLLRDRRSGNCAPCKKQAHRSCGDCRGRAGKIRHSPALRSHRRRKCTGAPLGRFPGGNPGDHHRHGHQPEILRGCLGGEPWPFHHGFGRREARQRPDPGSAGTHLLRLPPGAPLARRYGGRRGRRHWHLHFPSNPEALSGNPAAGAPGSAPGAWLPQRRICRSH